MEIKPVAFFRSPVGEKFGLPRQAGLAASLRGSVVLLPEYRSPEALRGLETFDHLWLVWGFHLNRETAAGALTVRPPRLGGNRRVGVFASRSPYRPNGLGLSCVRIAEVDAAAGEIRVRGADLADGTPIYDIKPYLPYADSRPDAHGGFTDEDAWEPLQVVLPPGCAGKLPPESVAGLVELLAEDPRPAYQESPERIYGLLYEGCNVRFRVAGGVLTVTSID